MYYGYRYLNTSTGRWLSKDPIEEEGGLNPYGFVENTPVTAIDPAGLCTDGCKCIALVSPPDRPTFTPHFYFVPPDALGQICGATGQWRFGDVIHIAWQIEGDPQQCHYYVSEPKGGLKFKRPDSTKWEYSAGTGGEWQEIGQIADDPAGINVGPNGQYSERVHIRQKYKCVSSDGTTKTARRKFDVKGTATG